MKLNTKARYAVRLMADIMKHGGEDTVPMKDVAGRQGLSKRYLSQLATSLKNAQLLKSVWGMNGGYKLSRPGREITILEIVEAVEGPIRIIDCVDDDEVCMRNDFCECRTLWKDINDVMVKKLESYTLEDLVHLNGHSGKKKK